MTLSVAELVREKIAELPQRSFVRVRDLESPVDGERPSRRAIEAELWRLTRKQSLVAVRKGLYWKGPKATKMVLPPSAAEVALAVGGVGSGPCDISAARYLGLTTQVPSRFDCAVAGRAPSPLPNVIFHARSRFRAVHQLRPAEVAVVEVLRMWPSGVEETWRTVKGKVRELERRGDIRPDRIGATLNDEHSPSARALWWDILDEDRENE